jgi:hypothetical protein
VWRNRPAVVREGRRAGFNVGRSAPSRNANRMRLGVYSIYTGDPKMGIQDHRSVRAPISLEEDISNVCIWFFVTPGQLRRGGLK